MKKYSIHLVFLFGLFVIIQSLYSQETRISGTIKIHPWISLPAVISTDIQGGMQSLGNLDLTATPLTVLNTTVPAFNRKTGMIASVIDAGSGSQTRYFEYLGTDTWREVFVINVWEPNHAYVAGDYVAYQQNYYVANSSFTSDASTFATNAANWNNAGGKDSKYLVSELTIDSKALSKVAVTATTVAVADLDKTITTAGYVAALTGGGASINTNRIITLSGTNVTGQNLGAGGKTMAQFFDAFFFPAVAATPPASTLTTTTTTFPYSTWKNWPSYTSNLDFAWTVTNVSQTNNTDDKLITSIKLKTGVTELASATPTGNSQTGSFTNIPLQNTSGSVTADFTKIYTLEVIDAQPQTVNQNLSVIMSKAIRLTYGVPTLTPATTVYEYDVNNKSITLNWAITPNDESVTNISVDGTSTGSTASTGTQAVTFKTLANGGTVSKTFPLIVTGNIYGAGTAQNSASVSWDNRLYRGTITSAVAPSDGSFSFDDTKIKALPLVDSKLGGNWKSTAGYDFVCGAGGQYVCFAYPDDAVTPVVQYYDSNFSSWMTYVPSDLTIINRANFVNQLGYNGTNYKLVFINVQYFSATVKVRLQ